MSQEQIKTISGGIYDVYTTSSQEYKENRMPRVGQKCEFEDGRKFVFCSTEVDIAVGQPVSQALATEEVVDGAVAAGAQVITVDAMTGVSANDYKDGYITLSGPGAGVTYKIKSNTATYDTNHVDFTLYDYVAEAIADDAEANVAKYACELAILGTATNRGIGVAAVDALGSTNGKTWFWAQYAGVGGAVLATGATAEDGAALMQGAGGLLTATAGNPIVAVANNATAVGDTETAQVCLCFPSV